MQEITGIMGGCPGRVIVVVFTLIFCWACKDRTKVFTIGVAANPQRDASALSGLRQGMAELGYEEGKNLEYIYQNIMVEDEKVINPKIEALMKQDIDILFVMGASGGYVEELTKGTNFPVLFCGDPDPLRHGSIESLSHPGGNITGVRAVVSLPKMLEWLTVVKPGLKKVWMPYDPDDPFSFSDVSLAKSASSQLGIEISLCEVHSAEEIVTDIENLPEDVDAIFVNPSRAFLEGIGEIVRSAIDRRLPIASAVESVDTMMMVLSTDFFDAGRKTARLANQIFQGKKPSELPIETPDAFLTVNLKSAEKIGLTIPVEVLMAAKKIIR